MSEGLRQEKGLSSIVIGYFVCPTKDNVLYKDLILDPL